jgi:SAM-dependent methyltransferase
MDQQKIWDYFQGTGADAFAGNYPRLRYLLDLLPKRSRRALNIGVGNGAFERLALKRKVEIHSLDPSEGAIQMLRRDLGLGDRAKVGFSQAIPFSDESFDAVFASEVFEHLDGPVFEQSLQEIKRILRPGGVLIGTVPSEEDLDAQIVVCPKCGEIFHRWGHAQSFSSSGVAEALERFLQNAKVRKKHFVHWGLLNVKGRAWALLKVALLACGLHGRGETLVFVANKPKKTSLAKE